MKKRLIRIFLLLIIIDAVFSTIYIKMSHKNDAVLAMANTEDMSIYFLDVGQGDCHLIMQNNKTILIDCGENEDFEYIADYFEQLNINKIDYLILTHPHEDHIGSGDDIVKQFDIGKIYMPYAWEKSKEFYNLLEAIEKKDYEINVPIYNEKIEIGDCVIEFIGPRRTYSDINEMSLNVKITYGQNKFLFMGDSEDGAESDLLASGCDLQADLIKVGHHGSSTSSGVEFLDAVMPKYAIIPCGENNDYGHPHIQTLQRFSNINATVYRTDKMGTIQVTSDGQNINVITENNTETDNSLGIKELKIKVIFPSVFIWN